jgi:hypothetical protein
MRDLLGAPAEEVARERARVATEGAGARLLALQGDDGTWGGAAWNRGWNSTMHVLMLLRDLGLDPASAAARRGVGLVRDRVTWSPAFGGAEVLRHDRRRRVAPPGRDVDVRVRSRASRGAASVEEREARAGVPQRRDDVASRGVHALHRAQGTPARRFLQPG